MAVVAEVLIFIGVFAVSNGIIGWWKDHKRGKMKGPPPPAFPSLPFVGSLPFIRGWNNISECFLKSTDRFGPIFTLKVGSKNVLVLNSRESMEEAYVRHSRVFSGRAEIYIEMITNPNRKGIVSKGTSPEWKRIHQLSLSILKEFGFGIKNLMEERILKEVEEMVDYLRKQNIRTFCPDEIMMMVSTNIMNNIVFGRRIEYEHGIGKLFVQLHRFIAGIDLSFDVAPLVRFLPLYRKKLTHINESLVVILEDIKQEIERCQQPEADDCFVRRYLEKEGIECDEEQLTFTLKDLLGAGSDTSAATLLWSLATLANHPEVQGRLRAEIDEVVSRDRFPSMNDQHRLPFVEATILEIMRWKTLAPLSVPRETLSDVLLNGYFVPAGTMVMANLYAVHMDPKVWTDPNYFRPERFLDDENKVIGRDRLVPFSLGRRSCMGESLARAEIFLILTSLVQNFTIQPPEGQNKVEVKPLEPIGLTMIPLPFDIRLIPRI